MDRESKIKDMIVEQLKTVYDPEIPVNIYDLGLIYNLDVNEIVSSKLEINKKKYPIEKSKNNSDKYTDL